MQCEHHRKQNRAGFPRGDDVYQVDLPADLQTYFHQHFSGGRRDTLYMEGIEPFCTRVHYAFRLNPLNLIGANVLAAGHLATDALTRERRNWLM